MTIMKLISFLLRLHYENKIRKAPWIGLRYGNPSFDPKTGIYSLDCLDEIVSFEKDEDAGNLTTAYLYLIGDEQNNVLYVGTANNVHLRLTQHLVKNDNFEGEKYGKPSSTNSQIKNVYDYLGKRQNKKKIYYKVIEVTPWYYKETIEHLFITFYQSNGQARWNEKL